MQLNFFVCAVFEWIQTRGAGWIKQTSLDSMYFCKSDERSTLVSLSADGKVHSWGIESGEITRVFLFWILGLQADTAI